MTQETKLSRSIRLLFSGSIMLGAAVAAQSAFAQQTPDAADSSSVQRVEITGSTIRRADKETPSPVQVISAEDIKQTGYTSIAQVLQNITANGSGTLNQGFSGAFAAGASAISLRGLSSAATLVLIDGHRMAPNALSDDNQRSFVDISNIPLDAIERVEVLKDGASAIYGSDAMAGVINVILKKNIVGTTVSAEAGTSTEGGGMTDHFTLTHGFGDFEKDGYNAYANLEYRHQDAIRFNQRAGDGDWIRTNWLAQGGIDTTPGSANNPATAPFPNTLQPYLINADGITTTPAPGVTGCTTVQMNASACTYRSIGNMQPQTENINLLTSFDKNLGDGWKLDVKASIFQSKADIIAINAGYYTFPNSGFYTGQVAGGPSTPSVGGVGATPVTYNGLSLGGVIPDSPVPSSHVDSKNYRLVTDLSGTWGEWDVDTSIGYTKNQIGVKYDGLISYSALQSALNSTTTPYSFTGNNPASVINAIFPSSSQRDNSTLEFIDFHVSRSLMSLAGGDLAISTGASYIYRNMNSPDAESAITGSAAGAQTAWVVGTQTDASAFAEIVAPVLKSLEIDGAVRFDHFDDGVGNATTPKIGFKWTPTNAFALRGTLATGFRAPNPAENGNEGIVFGVGNSADPTLCPNGPSAPGAVTKYCNYSAEYFTAANPSLSPEKSVSATLGVILEPVRGWATTMDVYRIQIKNQIVPGAASALPSYGPAVNQVCTGNDGVSQVPCSPGQGNNTGVPWFYTQPLVNANETTTSGVELSSSYKFKLGDYGSLKASLDYTHMMSYIEDVGGVDYQLAGTHGPSSVGGDTGNPKDKIQASLTYKITDWTVNTAFNWVGSYDLTDPTPAGNFVDNCAEGGSFGGWFPNNNIPSNYCKVASFLDTDVTVYYQASKKLTLHANISNVFNRQPPVDLATYGGMGIPFNPSLHEAGVIGRFINAGLDYAF